MTLIVEDGSIVTDANSYVDLDTIKAYALERLVTLGTDPVIESFAIKAMEYIESKRDQFQGLKVSGTQSLQFPRYYLEIDGYEFPSDSIPNILQKAQCQLVIEQTNGVDIMPTNTEPAIKKEVVGPITTEFAVSTGSYFEPFISSVENLLKPLLKQASKGFSISTLRV